MSSGKEMKGTVITYCEASKKIPNATDNNIKNNNKKKEGLQRRLRAIPVNFL